VPEGDTIHRLAERLRPALEGATLVRFEAPRLAGAMPRPGTTVTAVEAQGKYLLVRFADGWELQTHLRMSGRWDLYRTGQRWRRPAHLARVIIEVEGWVAVCSSAPVVRLVRVRPEDRADDADRPHVAAPEGSGTEAAAAPSNTWGWIDARSAAEPAAGDDDPIGRPVVADDGMRSHRDQRFAGLAHLGPDLCRPDVDLDVAVARMATVASPDDDIADVLLDQRVAAGVGNVFKSEVLWACELHPLTPLGQVDVELRRRLLETAAAQLQANLTTRARTTVAGPPGSLAVYGRTRSLCRRCGTAIRWQRTGRDHRSTYWCPTCQPAPDSTRASTEVIDGSR
jgi:endonuclease-8